MEFAMDASEDEFYKVIGEEAAKNFNPRLDLVLTRKCRCLINMMNICQMNWFARNLPKVSWTLRK